MFYEGHKRIRVLQTVESGLSKRIAIISAVSPSGTRSSGCTTISIYFSRTEPSGTEPPCATGRDS